jgi:hypothetical protein
MRTVSIAIKTKDRSPRKNYLGETLANMERAGVFRTRHLADLHIVDSGTETWARTVSMGVMDTVFQVDSASRTLHQNAARCIELAGSGSADWAMVLEDDLDFCDQFLESVVAWLEDHRVEMPQMYALGANYSQLNCVDKGQGYWPYPVGAFYGAQALVWRREVAAELAKWLGPDPFIVAREEEVRLGHSPRSGIQVRNHGHDLLLQRWGKQQGLTHFVASAPCMVQHVGNESGIGNKFFQFPWGGRDWRYPGRASS